ncbi:MAG: GAF domain-containing protein [Gammaproteobacteria bacterium]|nr:GAF domain-containing protein [Gammaproteobacteria bacterium]
MATRIQIDSEPKTAASTSWFKTSDPRLRRYIDCLIRCKTIALPLGLAFALILVGLTLLLLPPQNETPTPPLIAAAPIALGAILILLALWVGWRDYLRPMVNLNDWLLRIRAGDLVARIQVPDRGEFSETFLHLNALGEMLQSLSRDTEQQLLLHTQHVAHKTRALSILYDVAASINVSRDLNDLLTRFLNTLTEVVGANAAAVHLFDEKGIMKLVASTGLPPEMIKKERLLPTDSRLCSEKLEDQDIHSIDNLQPCWKEVGKDFFHGQNLSTLVVPLQYRGYTLGIYNLYVDRKAFQDREDMLDLFTSIGRHLGMAIDKARLDEETNRFSIIEERTRIAHELHDSLAQTLASIRFQVRVLDETLHQEDEAAAWQELERIENSVDEAHTEVRELIAHFRAPLNKHGLIPSIEQAVERFRAACNDTHIFLQKQWPDRILPAEHEIQILRIVQEALVNVRKHAQADTVRVLMQGDENDQYRILIEDDGVGLSDNVSPSIPGEHVGISIMKDRASRIGGTVRIESEPGEGVQVMLTFKYPASGITG